MKLNAKRKLNLKEKHTNVDRQPRSYAIDHCPDTLSAPSDNHIRKNHFIQVKIKCKTKIRLEKTILTLTDNLIRMPLAIVLAR